jgi:predicted dinucleotide-binding enzyme
MATIAMWGAGFVGRAIGDPLATAGHDIRYGTHGEPRYDDGVNLVSYRDSVADSDAVVLAIPAGALRDVLDEHSPLLNGRLIIDPTNNVEAARFHQLELFATFVPEARIARAWCSVGGMAMRAAANGGPSTDLLWCGVDGGDALFVDSIIRDARLNPIRVGGLEAVDIVEAGTRLVLGLIFGAGWPHATGLQLQRPD